MPVQIRSPRALAAAALAATLLTAACGDDPNDGGGAGETEIISNVTVTLQRDGAAPIVSSIRDTDGNGPQAPLAQSAAITLASGVAYAGSVTFVNDLETPNEDITEEVRLEDDEHRIYHIVGGNLAGLVTVDQLDTDGGGLPLGLTFRLTPSAGVASGTTGTLRIVLKHYDEVVKTAGASVDDDAETDIDISFSIAIE